MTQNIEQRTEAAVSKYEGAAGVAHEFANSENEHTTAEPKRRTLKGFEVLAKNVISDAVANTIDKNYLGDWQQGNTTFNSFNDYAVFNGQSYKPKNKSGIVFPYVAQGADPTQLPDSDFFQPFSDINSDNLPSLTRLYFNSVAEMKAANLQAGQKVETTSWISGSNATLSGAVGGGLYNIELLQTVRDRRGDQEWLPDGFGNHLVSGGSLVAMLSGNKNASMYGVFNGSFHNTMALQAYVENEGDGGSLCITKDGGLIDLDAGAVDVTGKKLTLYGDGELESKISGVGAFFKQDNKKKLRVKGLTFSGVGQGIVIESEESDVEYKTHDIKDCDFKTKEWAIVLIGSREGTVKTCNFIGGWGIKRHKTVNTDIISCYWDTCRYGVQDHDAEETAYTAGLKVQGGTMIGCEYGIWSKGSDSVQVSGVMIDYCDFPMWLDSVDSATVGDCYLSSRLSAAVILVTGTLSERSRGVKIHDSEIIQHVRTGDTDCISAEKCDSLNIHDCKLSFFARSGVRYSECTLVKINVNTIQSPNGIESIRAVVGDDSSNVIRDNTVEQPINAPLAKLFNNAGYKTENSGEKIVSTGTTLVIEHGLDVTPLRKDISLSFCSRPYGPITLWLESVSDSTITVGFDAAVTAGTGVAWQINARS